ncbi:MULTISPECIES: nucleotidyltransferase family protein [unclassified Exiguobacterium]|uniref:nucleotidyltransferase domain-containing protein n=1 Tax=unclassified Exiguobacterium TaxID=2644629 RepID=UPI001BE5DB57|nr:MULTISPECIES: nucleotidyltransferase family protein [unclassified Exiguobacterium]
MKTILISSITNNYKRNLSDFFLTLTNQLQLKIQENEQVLVENVKFHRLYPNPSEFSLEFLDLRQLQIKNNMQMLQTKRQLCLIAQLFDQENIPMICLKGPVILSKAYDANVGRIMRDLDLLVSPKHIEESANLLQSLGYVTTDDLTDFNYLQKNHHFVFTHQESNHIVELHWRLFPSIVEEPDFSLLWKSRDSIEIAEQKINCLNDELLFTYLIVHGSKHGWFRLKWLFDIHQFLQQPLNWIRVAEIADQWKTQHMMGQAMILIETLFEQNTPESLKRYMNSKKARKMAQIALVMMGEKMNPEEANRQFSHYLFWKRYFFLIRPRSQRVSYILHHFIPTQQDRDILTIPNRLQFLYVPLRPVTFLMRRRVAKKGNQL